MNKIKNNRILLLVVEIEKELSMNPENITLLSGPKKPWKCISDKKEVGEKLCYHSVEFDDRSWYDSKVPSHWQEEVEDLKNYEGCVWYRHTFQYDKDLAPSDLVHIFFKGVFYYTAVYLNGIKVGDHEGYFDKFYFGIHKLLKQGENVLAVKVTCYDEHNLNKKMQITGTFSHWDASDPMLNPGGIWNQVGLYESKICFIKDLKITTDLPRLEFAKENITLVFQSKYSKLDMDVNITISPNNFDGETIKDVRHIIAEKGINVQRFSIEIMNPKLWWTHDYGDQNLYDVKVELLSDGLVLDQTQKRTGIKRLHLDIDKENYGKWDLTLNYHRIFLKGTNIPPYQKIAYLTREIIEKDMDMLIEANMNVFRLHAHVDREEIHDVCDEKGLLIWQDLPLQWYYQKESHPQAKKDAVRVTRMLQHHPSQGIWCAHNEPFKSPDLREIIKLLLALLLSYIISELIDPFWTPYIQVRIVRLIINFFIILGILAVISLKFDLLLTAMFFYNTNRDQLDPALYKIFLEEESGQNIVLPYSGITKGQLLPCFNIPIKNRSDIHTYPGWYDIFHFWQGFRAILSTLKPKKRRISRFVTEYGVQAFPRVESIKRFTEYSDTLKDVEISWDNRKELFKILKKYHRYQQIFMNLWVPYKRYDSLESYIEATQEYQADLVKCCTDTYRQIKYDALGGIITFLGLDAFPSIVWSFIDYYREPKKVYYTLQKAFEKLYPFIQWTKRKVFKPGDEFATDVYVSNDYWESLSNVRVSYEFVSEKGDKLESGEFKADLREDSVRQVGRVSLIIPENPGNYIMLNLKLISTEKKFELENEYRIDIGKYKWRF